MLALVPFDKDGQLNLRSPPLRIFQSDAAWRLKNLPINFVVVNMNAILIEQLYRVRCF